MIALYLVSNFCHFDLPLPRKFKITGAQFRFSKKRMLKIPFINTILCAVWCYL